MKKQTVRVFALLGIFLLIIAIFADYKISCFLYNPSDLLARFLQDGFPLLLEIGLAYCFLMIFDRTHWYAFIGFLLSLAVLLSDCIKLLTKPLFSVEIFVVATLILFFLLILRHLTVKQRAYLYPYFSFFLQVFVMTFLTVVILKVLWGRIRFRDLQDAASFCPWYLPCAQGGTSFPSGHVSTFSACVLCFCSLPFIKEKKIFFIIAWSAICIMMISRVIMGAHYVSDTAAGMLVALGWWQYFDRRWEN